MRFLAPALALICCLAAPFLLDQFYAYHLGLAMAWAIAVLGTNVLTGYSGQLSLAHNTFMAVGAYAYGILAVRLGWPIASGIAAACGLSGALGYALGFPALRVRGLYLATVTLALASATGPVIKRLEFLTGGTNGLLVPRPRPPAWLPIEPYEFRCLVTLLSGFCVFMLIRQLMAGPIGRAMLALRDHQLAAEVSGVDITTYKTFAFLLSAACAGIAGALLCLNVGIVAPDSFGLQLSVTILAGAILGGAASVWGALFGGLVVEALPALAGDIDRSLVGFFYGLAIILLMYLMPGGAAELAARLRRGLAWRRPQPVVPNQHQGSIPMKKTLLLALLCLVAAVPARAADPGINDDEVKLAGSFPFSGQTSVFGAIARGIETYFTAVNTESGGVTMADGKKRRVRFISADDGYEAARALANAQQFVLRDHVFAEFGTLGTPTNLAMRDYLNEEGVPQLFAASSASIFSRDYQHYPWTIGWQLSFATEAMIDAEFLKRAKPNARVAMLVVNNDGGKELADAFESAVAGSGITIVAKKLVDVTVPSIDGDVVALQQTGADVFFNINTGRTAVQGIRKVAELGWKVLHIIPSTGSQIEAVMKPAGVENSEGVYTVSYLRDPSDDEAQSDPALRRYFDIVAKYGKGLNARDAFVLQGVAMADTMVQTLALSQPTRAALMQTARNLKGLEVLGLPTGVRISTTPAFPFPIQQGQLEQFHNGRWVPQGPVISARPG